MVTVPVCIVIIYMCIDVRCQSTLCMLWNKNNCFCDLNQSHCCHSNLKSARKNLKSLSCYIIKSRYPATVCHEWLVIHQCTLLAVRLTTTFDSRAALLCFIGATDAVLPTICRWWVATLSSSFTSSQATGDTAFTPLRPIGPSSINWRVCSTNSNWNFVWKSTGAFYSSWYVSIWNFLVLNCMWLLLDSCSMI